MAFRMAWRMTFFWSRPGSCLSPVNVLDAGDDQEVAGPALADALPFHDFRASALFRASAAPRSLEAMDASV